MVSLRSLLALFCFSLASSSQAQSWLVPDAPQPSDSVLRDRALLPRGVPVSSSAPPSAAYTVTFTADFTHDAGAGSSLVGDLPAAQASSAGQAGPATQDAPEAQNGSHGEPSSPQNSGSALDANGNPIPLNRQQPKRILGFMPNFRSVSGGITPHPLGWKYNFSVATHQAFDYSSFIFLGLTSITAEGMNSHPALGKGADGFYAYAWRGFLDKTDGTYLSAWLLPSILHEDTRYYALGPGHSIVKRSLYVISRQAVARTYGGSDTPNIAGLGGKVLTQVISRYYYPPSAANFGVLATKFGYAAMRDIGFSAIREFYPDIAAHYVQKHREKTARQAARDAAPTAP